MDNQGRVKQIIGNPKKKLNPTRKLITDPKIVAYINKANNPLAESEKVLATMICIIEYEYRVFIDEEYPLLKFFIQVEELETIYKKLKSNLKV